MTDILIRPYQGYPWVLSLHEGVVVRTSMREPAGRIRTVLPLHCGHHMHDDPKELAHMRRVIAHEEKING